MVKTRKALQIVFILIFCLTAVQTASAETKPADSTKSKTQTESTKSDEIKAEEENNSEQDLRLNEPPDFKEFLKDTARGYGYMWMVRLFYVRQKNDRIFAASRSQFFDNFKNAPEWNDDDSIITNLVYHPLFGAVYYLYYRNNGYSVLQSAAGSFILSTLFEYAIEGLVERPSGKDLIFTPGVGVPLGIGLETASEWLIQRENRAAKVAAYILNPTRFLYKDRSLNIFNPLTGSFGFQGAFTMNPSKSKAIQLAYPMFFESPLPLGGVTGSFEVVNLDDEFGNGQFIFYSIRLDFPSEDERYGIYVEIPYGGVNNIDVEVDGEEIGDGFEFGNVRIGGKFVLMGSEDWVLSGGLEITPPTAFKDNRDRLKTIIKVNKDLPLYTPGATTVTPYVTSAVFKGPYSLQANIGFDSFFNADKIEGDGFELRLKYSTAAGASLPTPLSPQVFVELDGYTTATVNSTEKTDLFITPGVKFGKKYGPGFGVQIPVMGRSTDLMNASFVVDFQARF